jgi:transposase
VICGVDVSSTHLDAKIGHGKGPFQRFERNAEGVAALVAFCKRHAAGLVVMEATGGYEKLAVGQLWAAEMPVAIVNPRSVRRFADGMGMMEKTDRIDAGIIAWYAEVKRVVAHPPASETQQSLTAWVIRLRQLTELRVAQANQRRLLAEPVSIASIDEIIVVIARQIRDLERRIVDAIAADPLWARLDAEFRTVKGVAGRTVARLMAELPEIGALSSKAVAKLTGLAPIANDSGKRSGKRPIRGGREGVRSILFVVAEIVRRFDKDFADFHKRLTAAGKPKKVVRTALAHKLLTRLNAKARDVRNALAAENATNEA